MYLNCAHPLRKSKPTVNSSLRHISGHVVPSAKLNTGGKTLPSQSQKKE